jgi:hypothetical protein
MCIERVGCEIENLNNSIIQELTRECEYLKSKDTPAVVCLIFLTNTIRALRDCLNTCMQTKINPAIIFNDNV